MHLAFPAPPRHVPLSLRIVNMFNGGAQFGWIFFGFGMIFVWVFGGNGDLSVLTFRGPHASSVGKVTGVERTGASENDAQVLATHYEFSVAGQTVRGTSYSTGSSASPGETVRVEYDEHNPARSRIAGFRRAMFGPWVWFVAIFPLVGLLILLPMTVGGLQRNRLLRHGIVAHGKLISKEATNMTVNRQRVFAMRFEFVSRDGRRCEAVARTTDTGRLQDEATEPLLYDPEHPESAYLLDELPSRPEVDPAGDFRGRAAAAAAALIIPGASILGHGFIAALKLGLL